MKIPRSSSQEDEHAARERRPRGGRGYALWAKLEAGSDDEDESYLSTERSQDKRARVHRQIGGGGGQRFGIAELIREVDVVIVQRKLQTPQDLIGDLASESGSRAYAARIP